MTRDSPFFVPALAGAVLLALLPGLLRWWSGRHLRADDPALPERLMARRARFAQVGLLAWMLVVVPAGFFGYWLLALALLGFLAGGYPLRRRVFGETWSLPAYVAWTLRLAVAVWGFWIALPAMPAVIWAAPKPRLVTAAIATLLLTLWHQFYAAVFLRLVGARPYEPETWPAGFQRVLGGARVPSPPRLWRAGPRGSTFANAVALPSLRGSHVVFTDPLLERLDDEEKSAVLAHEVSHLELFTRPLLIRWTVCSLLFVITGALLVPVSETLPTDWWVVSIPWTAALIWHLVSRGRSVKAQESPSDRRAVELCGNAEAMVSGLVKLHETGKFPRRWAASFEQRATHPSLARRIRAIREAAGQPAPDVAFPIVIRGTNPTAIVIESDRVRHFAGVPPGAVTMDALVAAARTTVAVPWSEILELRVDVPRGGRPMLVLALASGERWGVELDPSAIPAIQASLDTVDDRLPALPSSVGRPRTARLAVLILAGLVLLTAHWSSALLPIVLALLVPGPGPLLASAVAGVLSVAMTIGHASAPSMRFLGLSGAAVLAATWTGWIAWRWRHDGAPRDRVVHVGIGLGALSLWGLALAYSRADAFDLHAFARPVDGLVVLPLALAAAWAWSDQPRYRRAALVPLLLGLVGLLVSRPAFVDLVVRDPLGVREPIIAVTEATLDPIASAPVEGEASFVWLSPSGRTFVVAGDDEDEPGEPRPFTVGDFAGRRSIVEAQSVVFADDETLLTLEREGDGLAVRARAASAPARARASWSVTLPVPAGILSVDPSGRHWRVEAPQEDGVRRFDGVVGEAGVSASSWTPARATGTAYVEWMASDAEPLGRAYDSTPRGSFETTARSWLSLPWRMPMVLQPGPGREVRSRFDGNCHRGAPGVPVICVARDGTRSHVWTWDGRTFVPASRLDGDFYLDARSVSGWVSGWSKRRLALVAPDGARAYEVLGACTRARCVSEPVFDGHVLAGLVTEAGVTRVSTYRLRPVSSPAR